MNFEVMAIEAENISKLYRIGMKEKIHDNLTHTLFEFIKSPLENYRKYRSLYKFDDVSPNTDFDENSKSSDIIWALNDVSFEVKKGEVLGIIGKNGAGKSTLLKILSRITDPTIGHVKIRGRVSSLLEVGTGFHQELTGKENVYLNGAILGMTKKEMDQKFDEIVEFSGVEKFIHTPIKRYSSGMKVRLAFSVAAHIDPEILIVDEVLAVGDAEFQRKCLGKMDRVAKKGRAVLLVSHDMRAIIQLCSRVILLEEGRVRLTGSPSDVVSSYLSKEAEKRNAWFNLSTDADGVEVRIKSVRLLSQDNQLSSIVAFDNSFKIEIKYDVLKSIRDISINYHLFDSQGTLVFESIDTDNPEWKGRIREPGRYQAICRIPGKLLKPGNYHLSVGSFIERKKRICRHEGIISFDVSEVGYHLNPGRKGVVSPVFEWEINRLDGQPYR